MVQSEFYFNEDERKISEICLQPRGLSLGISTKFDQYFRFFFWILIGAENGSLPELTESRRTRNSREVEFLSSFPPEIPGGRSFI